jgi:hypothetical protein
VSRTKLYHSRSGCLCLTVVRCLDVGVVEVVVVVGKKVVVVTFVSFAKRRAKID